MPDSGVGWGVRHWSGDRVVLGGFYSVPIEGVRRGSVDQKGRLKNVVQIERSADLKPVHQRQAAVLALWRWRAPVLAFELDAEWGINPAVLESLFQLAASGEQSDRAYRRAITDLRTAPLFTSEVDPDTIQLFQLETISSLLTFGELLDNPGMDVTDRVIEGV